MTTDPPIKPLRPRLTTAPDDPPPAKPARVPRDLGPLPEKRGPTLTFSDGLNFGCGFWVAGFLFTIVAIPVAAFMLSLLIGFLGGLAGLGR